MYKAEVNKNKSQIQEIATHMNTLKKLSTKSENNGYMLMQQELEKEKENREAWRKTFVPSYFKSNWGKAFLGNKNRPISAKNNTANDNKGHHNQNDFIQHSEHEFSNSNEPRNLEKQSILYLLLINANFFQTILMNTNFLNLKMNLPEQNQG